MATPAAASPKPKARYFGGYKIVDKHTFARMVDWFRAHEEETDLFKKCAKACGVNDATAKKAYFQGLQRSGPECHTPIKAVLANERVQKTAISAVLLAAKTAGGAGPDATPEQRAELVAALGPTEFDQVRAEVRRAVRTEMDICEAHRALGIRSLRVAEKLAKLIEDRANALIVKFGPQTGEDGTVTPPNVGEDLPVEMRALEAMTRAVSKLGTNGRTAIEIERLRIGDPDALRRRLDSVYGSELGPAPGGAGPAEVGEERDASDPEDTTLPMDEVSTIEEWAGLRVIPGGLSKKDPPPPAPAPVAVAVGDDAIAGE